MLKITDIQVSESLDQGEMERVVGGLDYKIATRSSVTSSLTAKDADAAYQKWIRAMLDTYWY